MSGKRAGNRPAKQEALAVRLAGGQTIKGAAADVGVGYRTARLWLQEDAEFRALVERVRGETLEMAMARMTKATVQAAKVLRELMEAKRPSKTAGTRLAAAKAVLELALRMRETVSLEQRIAALEAKQKGAKR